MHATASMEPETTIHVGRSSGPTPNSIAENNREIANAPDHPTAIPQIDRQQPISKHQTGDAAGEAPIAMRMPISTVRCATEWAITA